MGNLCGLSTGEALSRWCAMQVSNNALADFATAPAWFANGMPDYVNQTDPTDQNEDATGCGMAFISWLRSLPGSPMPSTLSAIAQAMVALGDSGTLADLYHKLRGETAANAGPWVLFQAAIAALPNGVQSDDPFNAMGTPQPQPNPAPNPQPAPTPQPAPSGVSGTEWACLAASALIAGVADGETAAELKADVDGIST